MRLTKREREALKVADDSDGVTRGEAGFYRHRVGGPTLEGLIDRGFLERFPHPVAGWPMYRTTDRGRAALREPEPPKPTRTRPKLKMLKPAIQTVDTSIAKPLKRR